MVYVVKVLIKAVFFVLLTTSVLVVRVCRLYCIKGKVRNC